MDDSLRSFPKFLIIKAIYSFTDTRMYDSFGDCLKLLIPFTYIDRRSKLATLLTIFIIALQSAGILCAPKVLGYLIENYRLLEAEVLLGAVALLVLCWIAQYVMDFILAIVFYVVTNRAIRDLRLRVILHVNKASIPDASRYTNAEIVNANERAPLAIVQFMNNTFIYFFPCLLNLLLISWAITQLATEGLMVIGASVVSFVPAYFLLKPYLGSRHLVWAKGDVVRNGQMESLHNQIGFRMNDESEAKRISKAFFEEAIAWQKYNCYEYSIHIAQELIYFLSCGMVTLYLFFRLQRGSLSISTFIELNAYIFAMHRNMNCFIKSAKAILLSLVDLSKVRALLSIPASTYDNNTISPQEIQETNSVLVLKNIFFSHHKHEAPIIKNLNLEVATGDKLAIVGPSGIGKSTLCRILSGLYEPNSGDLKFFGQGINDFSKKFFYKKIKLIDQDCSLSIGTIGEILYAYGSEVPEVISQYFASRLDEIVGDSGRSLSNGERQRILIARTLAQKPEVIVLDESFSAMDHETGLEILGFILKNVPTVILVTHQRYLLEIFNKVYRLENGTLSEIRLNEL